MLIDVHTHLDHPMLYDRIDEIVENAKKAGVKAIITNGVDLSTNKINLEISKKYDIVKCAMGLYPKDALRREADEVGYPKNLSEDIDEEIKFIDDNKEEIIAIGEVGLDYHNGKDKEGQKKVFKQVIELSKKLDNPIIVHSRKAESDVIDVLEENDARKVILHCFSGKKKLVLRAAKLGYSFSIPANIVFSEQFQILAKEVPLKQLLTETDAPWLSPYKGKANEPAFISEAVKKIADIKEISQKDAENIIYMNYQKMFL
ncbi:TatD family hydrolase [Candidatus Woesearchaeota archaeon]|nr:TatD family hydrolase [Candidatus Woesearchaeota archaeon]